MGGVGGEIEWTAADVPVSRRFDDPYYSLEDGLAETEHVFLDGNGLRTRLSDGFVVAELGVGTGLNLLALARLAETLGVRPRYVGFEAYPLARAELRRALAPFAALATLAQELLYAWSDQGLNAEIGPLHAKVVVGDARLMLPKWRGRAEAWFLDGFAPAKNPELWEAPLLAAVADHSAPNGTFATYTAAGHVRRALAEAGFTVTRAPGFGRKRHMSRGILVRSA
ncbi:MAG: tRNA (5-methylaminomethyl-2-thiouridine)(34)-methyltransferase MnmD [Pseudomonadota bacterium]